MSLGHIRLKISCFAALLLLVTRASPAQADATLLLEEPYGHFGEFTGTGHAAVYLSRVCAESPTVLRTCREGETGVVLSRYNRIAGYDWLAIPLMPYLYAVSEPEGIPLFANSKIVAFLRNQYRKNHLEAIAPDDRNGEPPQGNWTELLGAAYDRTIYGFSIETSAKQDELFIRQYNSRPNVSQFALLTQNCADFAAAVINFYYPKTLHRNLIADAGITTPKQIAKLLAHYSARHPELLSASFVIPQVPGTIRRSTRVHGVIESILKSKKYVLPVVVLHPAVTGILAAAYLGNGRFDPARNAMILERGREFEPPLPSTERRNYQNELHLLLAGDRKPRSWSDLEEAAEPQFDPEGRPVLRVRVGETFVDMGISRENILETPAPANLAEGLLVARLAVELRRSEAPRASGSDVINDWQLLHQLMPPGRSLD
ncbi:MAG TPA: hypothetical protein VEI99_05460 [Terriglobales bacterium]|nr:hypothetical protein [Terriglobales bacterium]